MGVPACAEMLQVSERTIRGWESGATRIPYAAYKLMRLLRGGKVLGSEWKGFHVWRGVLCTPEGHRFVASDLSWLAFLVMQARCFRQMMAERRAHTQSAQALCVPAGPVDNPADVVVASSSLVAAPQLGLMQKRPTGSATKKGTKVPPGRVPEVGIPADFKAQALDFTKDSSGVLSLTLPVRQTTAQLPRSRKLPRSYKAVQS